MLTKNKNAQVFIQYNRLKPFRVACYHIASHAAIARKTTANVGGIEACASDFGAAFMPRTPASPKHSLPAGADISTQALSISASVLAAMVHVLKYLTHTSLHTFKGVPVLLHGAAAGKSW